MSEFIDRNELLKTIHKNPAEAHNERCSQLLEAILNSPTADVVEVVRCKDCKKWEQYENTSGAGYCHNKKYCFTYGATLDKEFTPITMPNDFCSYGKRREK